MRERIVFPPVAPRSDEQGEGGTRHRVGLGEAQHDRGHSRGGILWSGVLAFVGRDCVDSPNRCRDAIARVLDNESGSRQDPCPL